VGGTTLTTSQPGGAWVSETVWNWGLQPDGTYASSGGGISTNQAIPAWQQGLDMSGNGGSTTLRNLPDVACVADGIWVVTDNGMQYAGAGTSAAAPLWAGFTAMVNQQAAASGQTYAGFINPAIYAIGKSSGYASSFHDVTTGNSTNPCCGPNKFFARPGYDLCTGWGTPTGSNLCRFTHHAHSDPYVHWPVRRPFPTRSAGFRCDQRQQCSTELDADQCRRLAQCVAVRRHAYQWRAGCHGRHDTDRGGQQPAGGQLRGDAVVHQPE
jgi:subtilase family serine protease